MSEVDDKDRAPQPAEEAPESEVAPESAATPGGDAGPDASSSANPSVSEDEISYTAAMDIVDDALVSGTLAARLRDRLVKHGQQARQAPQPADDAQSAAEAGADHSLNEVSESEIPTGEMSAIPADAGEASPQALHDAPHDALHEDGTDAAPLGDAGDDGGDAGEFGDGDAGPLGDAAPLGNPSEGGGDAGPSGGAVGSPAPRYPRLAVPPVPADAASRRPSFEEVLGIYNHAEDDDSASSVDVASEADGDVDGFAEDETVLGEGEGDASAGDAFGVSSPADADPVRVLSRSDGDGADAADPVADEPMEYADGADLGDGDDSADYGEVDSSGEYTRPVDFAEPIDDGTYTSDADREPALADPSSDAPSAGTPDAPTDQDIENPLVSWFNRMKAVFIKPHSETDADPAAPVDTASGADEFTLLQSDDDVFADEDWPTDSAQTHTGDTYAEASGDYEQALIDDPQATEVYDADQTEYLPAQDNPEGAGAMGTAAAGAAAGAGAATWHRLNRRETAGDEPATRIFTGGQRARLTFTRQGAQVLKLDQGTRAISSSLRSVRSTIDTLNAGERIDPTKPTLVMFALVTVLVAILAGVTLVNSSPDWSFSRSRPAATAPASETPTAEPTESAAPAAPGAVVPQIASIEVLSVDNDGGDHQEWAKYLIDNDASTMWQSRYFGESELEEGNTVRLIVKLKEAAPVSEVVLTGPVEGGQVDLRINDGSDPFGTQVLTSAKMGATTTLTPSNAVEGTTVTLNFYALPTDDEGRYRVKLSALQVK